MRNFSIYILVLLISLSFSSSMYASRYHDRQLARSVMRIYRHKLPFDFLISRNVIKDKSASKSVNSLLQRSGKIDTMDTVFIIIYGGEFVPSNTYFIYNDSILEFAECHKRGNPHLSSRKCAYQEIFSKYYHDLLLQWDTITISEKPRMWIEVEAFFVVRIICKNGRCVSLDFFHHEEFEGMIPEDANYCIICMNSLETRILEEGEINLPQTTIIMSPATTSYAYSHNTPIHKQY